MKIRLFAINLLTLFLINCRDVNTQKEIQVLKEKNYYQEQFRPQYHFSPEHGWMNDPNGLVYYEGEYHLFYQYYPHSTKWGPMHWGHAVSHDLVHWEHLPIALSPDIRGVIFSGSIVVDDINSSGLKGGSEKTLIAIYTEVGKDEVQNQSLAYSNDRGRTWVKYNQNPVIKNPGIKDFRDPKVFWYEAGKRWILVLAAHDRVKFYSSLNLKDWMPEGDFGQNVGAHGGVWECPDLFQLPVEDNPCEKKWVLIVSLNPGGANEGSGTQYFIGNFNGKKFESESNKINWLDYGSDNYAGATWSNVEDRRIFIGWMSNWAYAEKVPTQTWRSANTMPRELSLSYTSYGIQIVTNPVSEINILKNKVFGMCDISITDNSIIKKFENNELGTSEFEFELELSPTTQFTFKLSNPKNQEFSFTYNRDTKTFQIDRTKSGIVSFNQIFAKKQTFNAVCSRDNVKLKVFVDKSSVEIYFDRGRYVATELVFPDVPYDKFEITAKEHCEIKHMSCYSLSSIWK